MCWSCLFFHYYCNFSGLLPKYVLNIERNTFISNREGNRTWMYVPNFMVILLVGDEKFHQKSPKVDFMALKKNRSRKNPLGAINIVKELNCNPGFTCWGVEVWTKAMDRQGRAARTKLSWIQRISLKMIVIETLVLQSPKKMLQRNKKCRIRCESLHKV